MQEITPERIRHIAEQKGFVITDQYTIPGRAASYERIPERICPELRDALVAKYPRGLYTHQSLAIDDALDGNDICLATSTASGKSLVFMAVALNTLLDDAAAKVLTLYPVRALIQDQLSKWREILTPFGIQCGFIDGGVPMTERKAIISSCRALSMTPDVAHAWLLSNVSESSIARFLRSVRLLVLDEAHVYDGVFGTNMAYFLRRFQSVTGRYRLIASTATIGEPDGFMEKLTGRAMKIFDSSQDGSSVPPKSLLLCRHSGNDPFEKTVEILIELSRLEGARFLAFGDSRKMIERIVAATLRRQHLHGIETGVGEEEEADTNSNADDDRWQPDPTAMSRILPYRAGYEPEDRKRIQDALVRGGLSGIVSTSALELGLDIGEIRIAVLMSTPPTVKSFHQRLGRAGRKDPAVCLILDDQRAIGSLREYLKRKMEPNWLYLDNRYIQYANALCAAREHASLNQASPISGAFEDLPPQFTRFLANELNPTEGVAPDLYPLKQRAAGGSPHHEFPIRSQMEQEFKVSDFAGTPFGTLSFSQALREAYPGAIHYYMARPLRVRRFDYRRGVIRAVRAKHWSTTPLIQSMVFPRFRDGAFFLARSEEGFLAEVELQVSERVLGFEETRGRHKTRHDYGPGSEFHPTPINRFFLTTGVCWYFSDRFTISEPVAEALLQAFCLLCGIQDRDLGIGVFHSKDNPLNLPLCRGVCIYDSTNGSLRLTQQLAERFSEVVDMASSLQLCQQNTYLLRDLHLLKLKVLNLEATRTERGTASPESEGDWVVVVAAGGSAVYRNPDGCHEVTVRGHRYTPRGLMYDLEPREAGTTWMVAAQFIEPIHGISQLVRLNLITGEIESVRDSANRQIDVEQE